MKTQLITVKPVRLEITLKKEVWIDPPEFFTRIADAGYAARKDEVRLTLTGTLAKEEDRLILTLEDVKPQSPSFLLTQGTGKDAKETEALRQAYREAEARLGKAVEIEGEWNPPKDKKDKNGRATLRVRRCVDRKEALR